MTSKGPDSFQEQDYHRAACFWLWTRTDSSQGGHCRAPCQEPGLGHTVQRAPMASRTDNGRSRQAVGDWRQVAQLPGKAAGGSSATSSPHASQPQLHLGTCPRGRAHVHAAARRMPPSTRTAWADTPAPTLLPGAGAELSHSQGRVLGPAAPGAWHTSRDSTS